MLEERVITIFSPTRQKSSSKQSGHWSFWNLKISEIMNCKYLPWTFSQFNCKNYLTRIFDLLPNSKQNLMHLFCDAWRRNFNLFENQAVKKGWISLLHESISKGGAKKQFCLCRNSRREFTLSITFKVIESPERF